MSINSSNVSSGSGFFPEHQPTNSSQTTTTLFNVNCINLFFPGFEKKIIRHMWSWQSDPFHSHVTFLPIKVTNVIRFLCFINGGVCKWRTVKTTILTWKWTYSTKLEWAREKRLVLSHQEEFKLKLGTIWWLHDSTHYVFSQDQKWRRTHCEWLIRIYDGWINQKKFSCYQN